MDFDLFREMKKHAVTRMQLSLATVERSDLPHWQIDALAGALLVGMLIYNAGAILFGVCRSILFSLIVFVLSTLLSPFVAIYVWFDLMLVTAWYTKKVSQRMKGEI